jgi:hypothetical protein
MNEIKKEDILSTIQEIAKDEMRPLSKFTRDIVDELGML